MATNLNLNRKGAPSSGCFISSLGFNKDIMRKQIQIVLITGTVLLWVALALLIVRQRHLLAIGDPLSDTGISFGYTFLTNFAAPALLSVTIVVGCIVAFSGRGSKKHPSAKTQLLKKP